MQNGAKIGVLGGDARQAILCRRLSEKGFETAIWGIGSADVGGAVRCNNWRSAIEGSKAVILPLPAFKEGKYVLTDALGKDTKIKI